MVCVRPALQRLGVRLLSDAEFHELSAHGILWRLALGAGGPPCRARSVQAQMSEMAERELRMERATDVYFEWEARPGVAGQPHEWVLIVHYV